MAVGVLAARTAGPESAAPKTSARSNEAAMTTGERDAVALLNWADTADPVADSKRAIAEK